MIKNIIFDLGGVIVKLDRFTCLESFKKIGFEDFGSILNDFIQEGFFLDFEKGLITAEKFRDIIREHIGKPVSDEKIDKAMADFLECIPQYKLDLIYNLKQTYKVYLLSNTNPIAMDHVRRLFCASGREMNEYFHKIYLSYEMKLAKPDPEIFMEVLKDAGITAEESLFIDDGLKNIQTARSLGIETLHISSESNLEKEVKTRL